MATLQVRTALALGASVTIDTSTSSNIVVNVPKGKVSVEAVIDSLQTDGYRFNVEQGVKVVSSAHSLICTGLSKDGAEVEAYAP